jgi:hypothetical protein
MKVTAEVTAYIKKVGWKQARRTTAAKYLGIHPMTLDKRLREEHTSWNIIINAVQREEYLSARKQWPTLPLYKLAQKVTMGYGTLYAKADYWDRK